MSAPLRLSPNRPSAPAGVLVAVAGVAAATALIYPLKSVTPVLSLGVLYVPAVLVVSMLWGLGLGAATSVLSAAAFNFFHLPPGGRFDLADERDWVALLVFLIVAVATGMVAELARTRSREAEQRRQEADLAAEMAQLLLGSADLDGALREAGATLAAALGARSAAISVGAAEPDPGEGARFELRADGRAVGALVLDGELPGIELARVAERIVPSLGSILGAALHREELQREVVETQALRRSDELKTAVLRSVSHDLRTPLTAILTAAAALDAERPTRENAGEVREQVLDAGTRLWRLIEKLLDLSVLQAGRAEPRVEWCSLEEVLQEAIEQAGDDARLLTLSVDSDLPLLRGDPSQLERAFANILENALRHSAGKPVSVRARRVRERVRVLVVDQGPGIAREEQARIFLPFYRARGDSTHPGSGLGLAITKGFLELNGARIAVESGSGAGTTFVVEFPLGASPEELGAPAGALG